MYRVPIRPNSNVESAHFRVLTLCRVVVRSSVYCGKSRDARPRAMVAQRLDLYFIHFNILHRLDLLRCRWLCCALRVGVSDNLYRTVIDYVWLVVGFAQAGAHRSQPKGHLDSGFIIVSIWKIKQFGGFDHIFGCGRHNPLYRAATAICHPIL